MLLAVCTGLVAGGASAREGARWGVTDRERADRLVENIEICRRLWAGPHALRRGAPLADGWMTTRLSPGLARDNWTRIEGYLKDAGRDPAAFPTMAYHNVNLNPDRQAALEESKRFLDAYYGPVFTPAMVEAWTAAGTPAQCIAHLRELMAEGPKTVTLRVTSWQQGAQFDRLVGEVLPRL
jgi:alkanesulfonate monooxygenase SsuD/methylene tetrahydromethanopterin reductase-like flavin-dependent oxidoreductase (luciferase family)